MMEKIKAKLTNFFIPSIVYVLSVGLIIRILFSFFGTLHLDQGTFISWSNSLVNGGFKNFYNGWSDYLPGYLYFLWILGKINLLHIVPQVLLYKLPAIIADLVTGYLIFRILKKSRGEKWGLIGATIYVINPAVLANSALWGQVDSLTSLFSILSIYLLPINYFFSAAALSIGTLIKPQAAFVFPVIVFMFFQEKKKITDLLFYCLTGLTIFVLGFLPFSNENLFQFIFNRLNISANQYPYTSVNTFNFWGMGGFWKPDKIYFQLGGYLVVFISTLFLCLKSPKNKNIVYAFLSFIFAASFMYFTRIHERHLLPVFAPLTLALIENPALLIPYIAFSLTYIANLHYSYIWITQNFKQVFSDFFIKFLTLINISSVIYIFYVVIKGINIKWTKIVTSMNRIIGNLKERNNENKQIVLPKISLSVKKAKAILVIILAFAFMTRTFNLGSPKSEYFDEVYHAFTAKVILHGGVEAWEWWNTPPEGFAYEWTHPPMAKLGMYLGMKIFGENSFGWRIPGALLGTSAVFLIYLIAKKIFDDDVIGLISAAVFSLDGLPLVLSRIGMNDSYILFFALLSIYLFMKEKDFWSALFFGFAIASKWSAIYTIPIFFIFWLKRKNKFKFLTFASFLILPLIIYLLSYLPMFTTGHNLTTWWGMQKQMWWYHTGLVATHPYTSKWWSWPFLIRPIYLYTSDELGGMVARIYAIGNPFVFWFGLASVIMCGIYSFIERNKKLGIIVFSYFIFFAPWAASPRIMFLYHYLPSIPFMCIAIAYILRRNSKLLVWYLILATILFVYFYPHWTGLTVPLWLDKSYYWLSTWR